MQHMCCFILALSPMLPLIYQNGHSNYLYFFSRLFLIFLFILLVVTAVVRC